MIRENKFKRIYEALLNRVGKICSKKEILLIMKDYESKFNTKINFDNCLKYFSRHNYIKRIFLSFYYINSIDERKRGYCKYEDKELLFLVLAKLNIRWYLGLSSALYELGNIWRSPVTIHIINSKFSGKRKILGLNIRFYKIKENLIFALLKAKTKNNIEFYYSDLSKTYIDMVYFGLSEKLIKDKLTDKHLKHFPKWVEKI